MNKVVQIYLPVSLKKVGIIIEFSTEQSEYILNPELEYQGM